MAKMFYTMDEVKDKLDKSEDEIKEMVSSGQIQEFRDRDKLMFKVEQIDLLAGDEDTGEVKLNLDDSAGGSGFDLSATGGDSGLDLTSGGTGSGLDLRDESGLGMTDSREGTGISVFDTDHGTGEANVQTSAVSAADASAPTGESAFGLGDSGVSLSDSGSGAFGGEVDSAGDTQVGDAFEDDLSLEAVGSGSGLLDLTRESDDTSLGAELLEEVYSSDDNIEIPANASGLFEAAGADSPGDELTGVAMGAGIGAGAGVPMMVEAYDGSSSGLGVGLMLGAMIALTVAAIMVIVGVNGATPDLAMKMAGNIWIWFGGLLGVTIIFGLVGMFIGKASE